MEKKVYITAEEQKKCRKIVDAFAELYEMERLVVLDAGRYGYVKLQYYTPPFGFDDVETFTNSNALFRNLWEEWLCMQFLDLAKDTPMLEMDYEDIFDCMPKDKQKELMDKRVFFARRAEVDIEALEQGKSKDDN